jgi:hypothetical protein
VVAQEREEEAGLVPVDEEILLGVAAEAGTRG